MVKSPIRVSIGIFAHNEEKYIASSIRSLLLQKTSKIEICEILVISSGSTDRTDEIVRSFEGKKAKLTLITQPIRRGKSAAINAFLKSITGDVAVTMSGDLKLKQYSLEQLILPFEHETVGMTGGRPKPLNTRFSAIGNEMELMWELHHRVSQIEPKCGEIVAFRNVIREIPKESAVDEATLEVLLKLIGYQIVYVPQAIVYNRIPLNYRDFFTQRRRVYAGHQWLSATYNHPVSTMKVDVLLNVIVHYVLERPYEFLTMLRLISMEVLARFLAVVDYKLLGKNPYQWKMIER